MKKIILTIVLLGFVYMNLGFCAPAVVYIYKKPPAPRIVKIGRKPYPKAVWVTGHWQYKARSGKFVWVTGYWAKPRQGKVWVKGHWIKKPRGWVYVNGFWRY